MKSWNIMKNRLRDLQRDCEALLQRVRDGVFTPQPVLVPIKARRAAPGAKDAS